MSDDEIWQLRMELQRLRAEQSKEPDQVGQRKYELAETEIDRLCAQIIEAEWTKRQQSRPRRVGGQAVSALIETLKEPDQVGYWQRKYELAANEIDRLCAQLIEAEKYNGLHQRACLEIERLRGEVAAYCYDVAQLRSENERLRALVNRCANIAETEPEPEGEMPDAINLVPLEDAIRATVRATRSSIAAKIRAALEGKP